MKTVILDQPLKAGERTIAELTLRPSTVGDEEDAQALAVELGRPGVPLTAELCLFSIITGVAYEDLRQMAPPDYEKLRAAYSEVVRPSRPLKRKAVPEDTTPRPN